jgi:hypothetical protein
VDNYDFTQVSEVDIPGYLLRREAIGDKPPIPPYP